MNFSQRFGLFILISITFAYVYFSFFANDTNLHRWSTKEEQTYNPLAPTTQNDKKEENIVTKKNVKIFMLDKSGEIRSLNRICDTSIERSCFEFSMKELIAGPTNWEKSKGFTSEIPQGTKILSIRESTNSVMIDLSSNFEAGGGAESTYMKVKQIIKTANANTKVPTYLYINGKQANVIGGEGIMIKQPLNERSFDE